MRTAAWWILAASLFLYGQAKWRSVAPDDGRGGAVHTLDGGTGQPPSPKAP